MASTASSTAAAITANTATTTTTTSSAPPSGHPTPISPISPTDSHSPTNKSHASSNHSNPLDSFKTYQSTVSYIKSRLPVEFHECEFGIVCGSGLGGLAATIEGTKYEIDYKDIPHFEAPTVQGHAGKLVFGYLHARKTIFMVGRFHFYEGHSLKRTTYPIRIMSLLGIHTLIVTNAAGGLNSSFNVGDIMLINDHISLPGLSGNNPLIGPNLSDFGARFPATSDAYEYKLRLLAAQAASDCGLKQYLREGVYCFVAGPSYETRAEARYLKTIGGDAVGMSTVPEVVVARHAGIRVLGLSLITNAVIVKEPKRALDVETQAEYAKSPLKNTRKTKKRKVDVKEENFEDIEVSTQEAATHEEVLQTSELRAKDMQRFVKRIVELVPAWSNAN